MCRFTTIKLSLVGVCVLMGAGQASALIQDGGFEDPLLANPASGTPWTHWVDVPGDGGARSQGFFGGEFAFSRPPTEGVQDLGWVSGFDQTRDNARVYQQFSQPANTELSISGDFLAYAGWGNWPELAGGQFDTEIGLYYDRLGRTDILPLLDPITFQPQDPDLFRVGLVNNGQSHTEATAGGDGWISIAGTFNSGNASPTGAIIVINRHKFGFFNGTFADNIVVTPEPATIMLLAVGAGMLLRRKRA